MKPIEGGGKQHQEVRVDAEIQFAGMQRRQ